ncbi:MAG: M14 family zinc carboxypeptidase [Granulosicoccus sp.]
MKLRNKERKLIVKRALSLFTLSAGVISFIPVASAVEFPDTPYIFPYEEIWDVLDAKPSPLLHVETIGEDSAGNELRAIKISDNASTDEDEPVFLFTGVIHGKEIVGLRSVLELAERLTTDYETDSQVRSIVDSFEIWIVPAMNPWGYQALPDAQRKNKNGVDLNSNSGFRWESVLHQPMP